MTVTLIDEVATELTPTSSSDTFTLINASGDLVCIDMMAQANTAGEECHPQVDNAGINFLGGGITGPSQNITTVHPGHGDIFSACFRGPSAGLSNTFTVSGWHSSFTQIFSRVWQRVWVHARSYRSTIGGSWVENSASGGFNYLSGSPGTDPSSFPHDWPMDIDYLTWTRAFGGDVVFTGFSLYLDDTGSRAGDNLHWLSYTQIADQYHKWVDTATGAPFSDPNDEDIIWGSTDVWSYLPAGDATPTLRYDGSTYTDYTHLFNSMQMETSVWWVSDGSVPDSGGTTSPLDIRRPPESVKLYFNGSEWVLHDVIGSNAVMDGGGP